MTPKAIDPLTRAGGVFLALSLIGATLVVSGCVFPDRPCDPIKEGGDYRSSYEKVQAKWRHTYDGFEETGGDGVSLAVQALRTSPPDAPYTAKNGSVLATTYVDWHAMRNKDRPEVLFDLMCLSELRQETAPPTFTEGPYNVDIIVGSTVLNDTIDILGAEHRRQNGDEAGEWCCYILFNDRFYGPYQMMWHITKPLD